MARGSSRRVRAQHPSINAINQDESRKAKVAPAIMSASDELETNGWARFPSQARPFLLKKRESQLLPGNIDLPELVKFWTQDDMLHWCSGNPSSRLLWASWYTARRYLTLGMVAEARTLMINGAFFHQCFHGTPIEAILNRVNGNHSCPNLYRSWAVHASCNNVRIRDYGLEIYSIAIQAIVKTPEDMHSYLNRGLQPDDSGYHKAMAKEDYAGCSIGDRMGYVNQIGDDWQQSSSSKNQRKSSTSKTSNGTKIQLRLVDDQRPNVLLSFDIESDTTLKTLFNAYSEKRCVSLRSLRFSYNGKTLFLSSAGNKTPDELSMSDQDIITVYDTNAAEEAEGESSNQYTKANKKVKSKKKKSPNKTKGKSKKKQTKHHEKDTLTLEDFKALHSQTLTKLHEEAGPQLKEIRMRLNALDLERQPRKQKKSKNQKKPEQVKDGVDYQILPSSGIGGKAGKPYFNIHVGEVSNLYKTTKPSQKQKGSSASSSAMAILDLHGFIQEEALQKLDESLITWVDAAMRGSYPFTIPAKIICGCGNQVLSEVVERWIHEHEQVANSPKGQQC